KSPQPAAGPAHGPRAAHSIRRVTSKSPTPPCSRTTSTSSLIKTFPPSTARRSLDTSSTIRSQPAIRLGSITLQLKPIRHPSSETRHETPDAHSAERTAQYIRLALRIHRDLQSGVS